MTTGTPRGWQTWIDGAKSSAYLLPVIAVLVVFLGHDHNRGSIHLREANVDLCIPDATPIKCPKEQLAIEVRDPGSSPEVAMRDLQGRLQLSTAMDTFLATFLILLCSCVFVIVRCRGSKFNSRQWLLGAIVGAVAVYIYKGFHTRQFSLLLNSFDVLVGRTLPKTEVELSGSDHLVSALAMLSSVLLAVTFATIIEGLKVYDPSQRDAIAQQRMLDDMKMRCAALKATLITGAALLAAGVIYIHALQNWAMAFVDKPELLRGAAEQWAVSQGSYWTLVLAAAYVPTAVVLHRATYEIARTRMDPADEKQGESAWLENHDLSVSVKGQMLQIVVLLAPWLTGGPLPELAKLVGAH